MVCTSFVFDMPSLISIKSKVKFDDVFSLKHVAVFVSFIGFCSFVCRVFNTWFIFTRWFFHTSVFNGWFCCLCDVERVIMDVVNWLETSGIWYYWFINVLHIFLLGFYTKNGKNKALGGLIGSLIVFPLVFIGIFLIVKALN